MPNTWLYSINTTSNYNQQNKFKCQILGFILISPIEILFPIIPFKCQILGFIRIMNYYFSSQRRGLNAKYLALFFEDWYNRYGCFEFKCQILGFIHDSLLI